VFLVACISAADHVQAATLYAVDYDSRTDPTPQFVSPTCNFILHGVIESGDRDRMEGEIDAFFRASRVGDSSTRREGNNWPVLCLESKGGDIQEALKLAELFRAWIRVVEEDRTCSSACAILFMAHSRREGTFAHSDMSPGRFLHFRGQLGFHAPSLELPSDQKVGTDDVTTAYARALATLGAVAGRDLDLSWNRTEGRSFVSNRFSEDILPAGLLLAFVSVPPDSLYTITRLAEAIEWGIEIYGFPPPEVLSQRMLQQGCINTSTFRCLTGGAARCLNDTMEEIYVLRVGADLDFTSTWNFDDPQKGFGWDSTVSTRRLWPPPDRPSDVSVMGWRSDLKVTHGEHRQPRYCEVRATWTGSTLTNLELATFNGSWDGSLTGELAIPDDLDVSPSLNQTDPVIVPGAVVLERKLRAAASEPGLDHFRLWKALPAGMLLSDLGNAPWSTLAVGGNAFEHGLK
jgi:hypothetical protein